MARIDKVREKYEEITDRLFSDSEEFAKYLKFAAKFFKLPSEQSMMIYGTNPNATMVTDFDTWKKFNRYVKRGTNSIAVPDNGSLKHYFDISQTNGTKIPYQWTLDKNTASALIGEIFTNEGMHFNSFSGVVNYLGSEQARENIDIVMNTLNISAANRAKFERSYTSMVQFVIAARCEMGSRFKYNGRLDTSALDMLGSKAEKERLCEFVQMTGKSVLLSLEKSINNIVMQERTVEKNDRDKTDMVRGGQEILSRNQNGERQDVQARSGDVRVSGAVGSGTDGGRTGNDERADRTVGREMAKADDRAAPRTDTVVTGSASVGTDTPTDRPRSVGVSGDTAETVRSEEPTPDNIRRADSLGEHTRSDSGQRDNGNGSIGSHRVNGATYSTEEHTENNEQTAEVNPPAVSFSEAELNEIADDILTLDWSLKENDSDISIDDYLGESTVKDRIHIVNMLSQGNFKPLTDFLQAVYNEAYENYDMLRNGIQAQDLINKIDGMSKSESEKIPDLPDDLDKFYVDSENERVTWVYFNPDSDRGGQLVYNHFTYDQLFEAIIKSDPLDYLSSVSRTELVDIDTPEFAASAREFLKHNESFSSNDEDYADKLSALIEPRFAIFQLRDGENMRDYRFRSMEELRAEGKYVDRENYTRVYRGRLKSGETLDDIYERFNINRPDDFTGHSLSVSDIITVRDSGKISAHYVDRTGFEEIPDFTLSREERIARRVISDNLIDIADSMLASDEMDDLGNKLFNYENAPHYHGDSSSWIFGNGMTADKFEEITTRYNNGEDVRAELAKGVYQFGTDGDFNFYLFRLSYDSEESVKINAKKSDEGITFTTKGGFQRKYSWEELGEAVLKAARREFDRHEELDRQYREDLEQYGNLYLALRDKRTIYLNRLSPDKNNYTDYRLEQAEKKGTVLTAANENNERVEVRDFYALDYSLIVHSLLDDDYDKYEVAGIEREPVFKVEANPEIGSGKEAFLQAYEKSENGTLIPRDVLFVGSFEECNGFAEELRLGEISQESVRNYYAETVQREEDTRNAVERYSEALSDIKNGSIAELNVKFRTSYDYGVRFSPEEHYTNSDMSNFKLLYNEEHGFHVTCDIGDAHKDYVFQKFGENSENLAYYIFKQTDGEIHIVDPENKIISDFKERTRESFNPVNGRTADDVQELAREYIGGILADNGIEAKIVDLAVTGSRSRGIETGGSDIDITAEFDTDMREDALFDLLHEKQYDIDGITIDINPIRAQETGTLGEYLPQAEKYLSEKAEANRRHESAIHFGLLGNGITCYDTSRTDPETHDYPTVAHISNEGNVKYYDESLNADEKQLIEKQAAQQKQKFTEEWNKLDTETKYERILNEATVPQSGRIQGDAYINGLTIEDVVKKYEHSIIFKDEEMPDNNKLEQLEWSKEQGLYYYPAKVDINDFAEIKQKSDSYVIASPECLLPDSFMKEHNITFLEIGRDVPMDFAELWDDKRIDVMLEAFDRVDKGLEEQSAAVSDEEYIEEDDEIEPFVFDDEPGEPIQLDFFGEPIDSRPNERGYVNGVNIEEAFKREFTSFGTGMENGKFAVEMFYKKNNPNTVDFAKFLSKEYGVCGHSGDGKIGFVMYNGKGATLTIHLGNGKKTDVTWKWNKVAKAISDLIEKQEYISPKDIEKRISSAKFDMAHNAEDSYEYKRGAAILDGYGLLEQKAPAENKAVRKDDDYSVNFSFISDNPGSIKAVKEFALSTGASVEDISPKSLKSGLFGINVDTWESRAEEIKQTAVSLNISEISEWGVHQVVSYDRDSGSDDKYNYRFLSDAKKAAESLVSGNSKDLYDMDEKYDGALVYNLDTKKFEAVYGDFPVEKVFSDVVLKANGIDVSEAEKYELEENSEHSEARYKEPADIKAGDRFMYRGKEVTVTDDKGLYPDDIVITQTDTVGGVSYAVTNNVDVYAFAREAQYIPPAVQEQNREESIAENTETQQENAQLDGIKTLAELKRALALETEFEITSFVRNDVENQLRRVNFADTTGIYTIRPDAPDSIETLANNGLGSYLKWGKAADWEFSDGTCTAYQSGAEHTEENRLFSLKSKSRIEEITAVKETQKTAEPSPQDQTNPIIAELAKTYPPETAEQLYNVFEGAKRYGWEDNQAVINRMKHALYDVLGNEEQTERAFSILAGETFSRERESSDLTAHIESLSKGSTAKIDYTITDEHLGEGGAKAKFAANIAAIEMLKKIESRNLKLAADMFRPHNADPEEQKILAGYVGWGGLAQAFDPNNASWSKEYQQLKELLTEDEYNAAKASTLNAHYTTPTVINAIYKGLQQLGFDGGNILEPAMGVGNFFGAMPEELRKNSHLSGVELDSITGRIAQQLYQSADIQIKGFEKTDFSDNYFDAVVGNVPFGSYSVSDKKYNRENFFIHDYFLAKSLDKLAPGGVMAVITTKGTMDKENPKVREYLAKRADLIGAIRLPNTAFKANAGTEVTADILFFQKREKMAVELPDWCYIGRNTEGIPVNNYFLEHPEMVLGTMKQGVEYSLYGNAQSTACVPFEGADLAELLDAAVKNLKVNHAITRHNAEHNKQAGVIPAVADVRNFTFAEVDGKMYFRENNIMTEATDNKGNVLTGKTLERIRALNELRQTFRTILTAQENDCSDAQLEAYQKTLNEQYDAFVKKFGYINDKANYQAFSKDDDYNSLCALEVVDEETKEIKKADFFTKRTVNRHIEITHVDTPQEALQVSIDMLGKLDFEYMGKLCGCQPEAVVNALKADNLIFLNPVYANPEKPLEGWEEATEYLSGNVRVKLREAERAAENSPDFQHNVEALTAVIPQKVEAGEITARIGVHWVDVEDYQKFAEQYANAHFSSPLRRTVMGEYKIEGKRRDQSATATQLYGTQRMTSLEIFENLLNNRDVVVKDKITDPDGREHYELNKKETELAQDKALKMKEAFKRWLWEDPARREKYVTRYNELFNSLVGRKFDGSHQTFVGMNPTIKLKPHQLDAVMRTKFGGNTLLAHCVGAGKSFEMIAATMEKKRLGLINKACVVVPKSLVGQMANEWLRLYPQAKILTASEKDFDKDHRQKFIGRCCTGDYDAVIMSYEQFEKIPMSFEYRRDFIQREIDTLTEGIDEIKGIGAERGSVKDMERMKKRLEARLDKLIEDNGKKKDTSLNFEQLGFDSLVVDEAHNYKNGLVVTKMQRVAGVQTTPAQKSEDILMKTQYLNENYGEKNIIFATGTPVSNSMTELYIMQRYLRPSLLEQAGLQTFDDWASSFGEVVSKAELKPAGNGYRTKKRFAKFNNLPELMAMYKEFADIRTADMLDLDVPKIEGGKPQTIAAEPNDFQKAYMEILAARSDKCHNGTVDPSVDNMLRITGEARLLGLDARCINPNAQNYPDSKVNLCIDKVMEIYTATTESKGVQAIFCDIAVNGDYDAAETTEGAEKDETETVEEISDERKFSAYKYIKAELVKRGIPEDEICFAGDANTTKKQNEMKADLRSGKKRIVISSTSKLGTGANIQNKLVALHNLDIPWKPSDLEQRLGRIIRQGNDNKMVGVFNYVTKNTFDAYLMNIIVTKQKFISQLMSGKTPARTCEDCDETVLNYSQIQAIASGDPRIKEKIELDTDVARLKMLENEHYNEQYRLDDTIADAKKSIRNLEYGITAAKNDLAYSQENKYASDNFKIEIGGKVYTERKEAGAALRDLAVKFMANEDGLSRQPIGSFCGFELAVEKIRNGFTVGAGISIKREISYLAEMDIAGDIGNITRLENLFNAGIQKKLEHLEDKKERTEGVLQAAIASKGKPFEHAEELAQKSARLEQLNLELEVGKADEVIMNESEDEEKDAPEQEQHEQDSPDKDRSKPTTPKHGRR